jgi:hypothetical protein
LKPELFEDRRVGSGGLGLALIRDSNGRAPPRHSCATAARPRPGSGKALRAERAQWAEQAIEDGPAMAAHPIRRTVRPPLGHRLQPNEPERGASPPQEYVL